MSGVKLPIEVGQKFLSGNDEFVVRFIDGKQSGRPVCAESSTGTIRLFTLEGMFDQGLGMFDLQPLPIVITESVELYRLVRQHTDANGNVLKVGDRVEFAGRRRATITNIANGSLVIDDDVVRCSHCRKLTTRKRPLCEDDLDKAPCPMFKICDDGATPRKVCAGWDQNGIYPYADGEMLTWIELQGSSHQWRPSADQPWQPCEVTEEVLV